MKKKPVDQYKSPKFLVKFATFAGALGILGGCRSPHLVGDVPNVTPPDTQVQSQDPEEVIELEGDVAMPLVPDENNTPELPGMPDAPNAPEETPTLAGEVPESSDPEEVPVPAGEVPASPDPEDVTALAGDVPCPTDPGEIPESSEPVESPDLVGDVSISTQPMEVRTVAGGFPSLQGLSPEQGAPWKGGEGQ